MVILTKAEYYCQLSNSYLQLVVILGDFGIGAGGTRRDISLKIMSSYYSTFNNYLRNTFGTRVYRVPIDADFTCPNRDGTKAFGGCTFCDDRGSGAPTIDAGLSVRNQLIEGIERIKIRYKAKKFLAYFQAFSNTYAPEATLKSLYDTVLEHPDVIGLCIGTRPDCVPDNVLDLLAEYNRKTYVLLELGLQSAHNRTLDIINRGHTAEEFFDAVKRTKARGLTLATHLIFGLPGESREEMIETVRQVAGCEIDAIKIHQLCIYQGTPMATDFQAGRLQVLDEDYYVNLVVDAVEMLPPNISIMRLVAEGSKYEMMAPTWAYDKFQTMEKIEKEFARRQSKQGSRYLDHTSKQSVANHDSYSGTVCPKAPMEPSLPI